MSGTLHTLGNLTLVSLRQAIILNLQPEKLGREVSLSKFMFTDEQQNQEGKSTSDTKGNVQTFRIRAYIGL